ncbi:Lipase, class 3 [Heterobasidion irregulare TC 32-1]|uniref:Lipase, class 3 n=1 Tax=Heterobasidion irregulare (strain TC 32-1) TaxID=747525 RepID=W4K875_HETIT|nr:Lipase, class 3 [Heterobasidion irregulare TC 32-1]ETW81949.1 Lipase, class 3 [Heterobasidion irregulare TC 32-1]
MHMAAVLFVLSVLLIKAGVSALPTPRNFRTRASPTALSPTQLSSFAPFTQFARAAYCDPSKIEGWQCGEACDALPGFEPTLTGGDANSIQFFFVGFWPDQNTVVVAHQGTDPTKIKSDLTDLNIAKRVLDPTLFPGVPDGVEVHSGFADAHEKTASQILTEVKRLMATHRTTNVTLIGHSLGGALAELDSLFMKLNLPMGTTIKGVTYGTPRVGNSKFVTLFDQQVSDFTRVNNKSDLVPIIPGRFLGFAHPHGEVHIVEPGNAVSCPGDDDAVDSQCQIKTVSNIFEGNILDHLGAYEGIFIGTPFCT